MGFDRQWMPAMKGAAADLDLPIASTNERNANGPGAATAMVDSLGPLLPCAALTRLRTWISL
jgi:hypothetical protein